MHPLLTFAGAITLLLRTVIQLGKLIFLFLYVQFNGLVNSANIPILKSATPMILKSYIFRF